MKLLLRHQPRFLYGAVFLAFVFIVQITPLQGAERPWHFLTPESVDAVALLPAPPLTGSPEQLADMNAVVNARKVCSSNDLVIALEQDRGLTAFNMAPFLGDYFRADRLPKTTALFQHVQVDTAQFVSAAKNHFQRLRPSVVDTNLLVTKPTKDFSYPSGHSTAATIIGLILMELEPEHAEQIFVASRSAGWHRVQLARHYPTDIQAGRVLAQAVFHALQTDPRFQKEFAEAKQELDAAKVGASTPALEGVNPAPASAAIH